jgi:hypothetical protein
MNLWTYQIKSITITEGAEWIGDSHDTGNKLNSQSIQIYPYLDKIINTCYEHEHKQPAKEG